MPKSSMARLEARLDQAGQVALDFVGVFHQHPSVISSSSCQGRGPWRSMQAEICGQSSGSRNCSGDRLMESTRSAPPPASGRGWAQPRLQHQLAELADEPQLLRQRDELVRGRSCRTPDGASGRAVRPRAAGCCGCR